MSHAFMPQDKRTSHEFFREEKKKTPVLMLLHAYVKKFLLLLLTYILYDINSLVLGNILPFDPIACYSIQKNIYLQSSFEIFAISKAHL